MSNISIQNSAPQITIVNNEVIVMLANTGPQGPPGPSSGSHPTEYVSSDFNITNSFGYYVVSTASGAVIGSLPSAASVANQSFVVARSDITNGLRVVAHGSDTINEIFTGAKIVGANNGATFTSDGINNWNITGTI